jgi:hypothetical protein
MTIEERCVRETLRKLRLKSTRKDFEYFDQGSGQKIKFDWDGAGVSTDGAVILIEVELGGISDWHIQCHLCRLAVMVHKGTPISKLVWVVDQGAFQAFENCVNTWLTFFKPLCNVVFPPMEYRNSKGELLCASKSL